MLTLVRIVLYGVYLLVLAGVLPDGPTSSRIAGQRPAGAARGDRRGAN